MIVPGVLTGNRGSLLYPEQEIRRSVTAWNGVPVVINHPRKDGRHVSARHPSVLDEVGVGMIFNARISKSGSLEAEAWIDIEKLRRVDSSLAERIERGDPIEVSTGLGTENELSEGTYNGRPYKAIAKNYAPDHLAILPNERGACSIDDGCGLSVNELSKLVEQYEASSSKLPFSQWYAELNANEESEIEIHGGCRCGGTCGECQEITDNEPRTAKMSICAKQRAEIIERLATNRALHRKGLESLDDKTLVSIVNAEMPEKKAEAENQEDEEDKEEMDLENMDEKLAEKVKNMAKKLAKNMYDEKMKENQKMQEKEDEKPTANAWLKSAPPEIRRLVENARAAEQAERSELIQKITANNSMLTSESLESRSLEDLRLFATFIKSEPRPAYNYAGAAAPPPTANARSVKAPQPLGLPGADYMTPASE